MASIHNSRANKYARLMAGDEPSEHLESIGDCLIKELAEKQTDTKLTLEKQFRQEKQFQKGTGFVSLSSLSAGTSSLEHFQKKTKDVEVLQQLTARGLTVSEAKRYISGQNILYSNKAECSAQEAQQDMLSQCLDDPRNNQNIHTSTVSRQERELALSMKPNSVETKLLQFVLTCKQPAKVDLRPETHPINKLADIEKELFKEHIDPLVLAKTVKRKRRQQLDTLLPPQHVPSKPVTAKGSSLWDVVDKPTVAKSNKPARLKTYGCIDQNTSTVKDREIVEEYNQSECKTFTVESVGEKDTDDFSVKSTETKRYGCIKPIMYTIKDGKIVSVEEKSQIGENIVGKEQTNCGGQPFVSTGQIDGNSLQNSERLTESEIKQMPKFKNYERGKLNKTLYIKNIASSVKEDDLVAVFCRFEDPKGTKLVYRLMHGKMRGQAFVSFSNSETAAMALECVNGLFLKGKPLIIQFGKDSNG